MNEIVSVGYDAIAEVYTAQRDQFSSMRYLDALVSRLTVGAKVLDLGCGAGLPVDRYLLQRGFQVTGVDLSSRQIELAKLANPAVTYAVRDMLEVAPGEFAVDAVASFYAIFHTPRELHAGLLQTLRSFLQPGGLLLITMGATDWEGTEPDFHGVEMFWSHYDAVTNRRLVEEAGFRVLLDEIDASNDERHQVLLAEAV